MCPNENLVEGKCDEYGIWDEERQELTGPSTLNVYNLVVDPSSKYLYVLDAGDGTVNGAVYGFSINSTTGAIGAAIAGSPSATGVSPQGNIVIDPTGTLLAADNNGKRHTPPPVAGSISLFKLVTGGALTPTTPAPVATGDARDVLQRALRWWRPPLRWFY